MKSGVFFFCLCLTLLLLACENEVTVPPPTDYGSIQTISYSQHVQPLLSAKCATTACHNTSAAAGGLDLSSWDKAISGSSFGEVLVPFKSTSSLLVTLFDETPARKVHPAIGGKDPLQEEVDFLARWIEEGARNDLGEIPFANSTRRLYVCNQADDRVAIIDLDALVVARYVDVGDSPGNDAPHFVVANADFWYLSLIGARQVWKFDAHTDTLVATAPIQGSPAILALTPDGTKLYVSQFMASSTNSIAVVNTATMLVVATIPVWTMPHGMRINHAGSRLYVANMMSDNLSVIDVGTDQVIATTPLAYDANPFGPPKYMPMEVAVSPSDSLVAVSCSETQEVRMYDAIMNALVDSILVGDQPWHLEFTPDGQFCYVCDRRSNTVSVVHVPMHYTMETISGTQTFAYPHGLDISADGRHTFASNENINHLFLPRYRVEYVGNISVIDNLTNLVIKVLEVGEMPTGISIHE